MDSESRVDGSHTEAILQLLRGSAHSRVILAEISVRCMRLHGDCMIHLCQRGVEEPHVATAPPPPPDPSASPVCSVAGRGVPVRTPVRYAIYYTPGFPLQLRG